MLAGVDEAGRGPLAGPVVAAAVILDSDKPIAGLADSKRLSARQRERLFPQIQAQSLAWSVAVATVEEIDSLNIFHATMLAMRRAIEGLAIVPAEAVIDGNRIPAGLAVPGRALVQGDSLEPCIMAASIVAKVTRDRLMDELHVQHPGYGFDRHRGYGTAQHLAALKALGPTPAHRCSFRPVRACRTP